MNRRLPKIAPGQLPPPTAKDNNSLSLSAVTGIISSPLTSPKKAKLNISGIEEVCYIKKTAHINFLF